MFTSHHKNPESHDDLVWRLLDAPVEERRLVLIEALQTDELSFEDTLDVLIFVQRIESLGRPVHWRRPAGTPELDPIWKLPIQRYVDA
jgi:hypothetical protein